MHLYNASAPHLRALFGGRAQKLSIDAGFSCPNRDGTLGTAGCSFCNNEAFTPSYLRQAASIHRQIDEGILFHSRRYHNPAAYLAYFQAFSNTHAPLPLLRQRYEEALAHPAVKGLVVGTRPDCVDEAKLDYLQQLARQHYVAVEYGIESVHDRTLRRVGRGHDMACARRAVEQTAARGIACGAHFILGLPGESRADMLAYADAINSLPLSSVKFHQLQILRGSALEHATDNPRPFALEEYISLVCDLLERLRPDIAVERLAGEVPPRHQADPSRAWRRPDGRLLRNEEIPALVDRELARRHSRQGALLSPAPATFPLPIPD